MIPVIRKIDEMGRIIIPKDIRKELKLYSNDLIKIKMENDNIIISKNQPNSIYIDIIDRIIESLSNSINCHIIITTMDKVISNKMNKNIKIKNQEIKEELINEINKRKTKIYKGLLPITDKFILDGFYILIPLILDGNCIGSMICFKDQNITLEEQKLIELTSLYLKNILEE